MPTFEILKIKGASDRALVTAFIRLRDAVGCDVTREPIWGPEDGCASLRKKDYRIDISYYHSNSTLIVHSHGSSSIEELKIIEDVLSNPPLPLKK
jgi:hypothetical protein